MGYTKLSVTIPDEIYADMKELASREKVKLSHLVTEALFEKARKMKEEILIQQINSAFEDKDVSEEQHRMAEVIAGTTDLRELPW
ncbi:MAG: hypothetical protein C4530_05130 [Desulfobacteraceae bacterium]|nr:MAG: hypothetical protein C4530_05130 [Desulfobacteraceae bacterium]